MSASDNVIKLRSLSIFAIMVSMLACLVSFMALTTIASNTQPPMVNTRPTTHEPFLYENAAPIEAMLKDANDVVVVIEYQLKPAKSSFMKSKSQVREVVSKYFSNERALAEAELQKLPNIKRAVIFFKRIVIRAER